MLLLPIDDNRLASSMELFPRAFRLFDLQELFLAQVREQVTLCEGIFEHLAVEVIR